MKSCTQIRDNCEKDGVDLQTVQCTVYTPSYTLKTRPTQLEKVLEEEEGANELSTQKCTAI